LEMLALGGQRLGDEPRGGAVDPLIGNLPGPGTQLVPQVPHRAGASPAEKLAAQVADAALDFAFRLRAIRAADPRDKAPVAGKIKEDGMPLVLAPLIDAQQHGLHAVVEDL